MRLMVVAGEPSGDRRAAELLEAMADLRPVEAFGLGGDCMARMGFEVLHHLSEYSVMGFAEVVKALPLILRLERSLRREALLRRPDAVLLVDYPGFNLRFARWASSRGMRVVYYVSPQLWAWGRGRVRKVRRSVDLMVTLFEFEADFYREHGVNACWAGHPLVDRIPAPDAGSVPGGGLALLPGSRAQEVSRLAGPMAGAFRRLAEQGKVSEAVLAVSPHVPQPAYGELFGLSGLRRCDSVEEALAGASAAIVCSGTATLETALHGVPFVIAYRTSVPTYRIARALVRSISWIGMPNLVAGEKVVEELVQDRANADELARAVGPLAVEGPKRAGCMAGLARVREALGPPGAARRAAERIAAELEPHGG
jgi:lipid-A-disaccharide synthase